MVGAREIGIGVGSLKSVLEGEDARLWCAAAALADTADVLAVSVAMQRGLVRRLPGLLFVAFAAAGVVADLTEWRRAAARS